MVKEIEYEIKRVVLEGEKIRVPVGTQILGAEEEILTGSRSGPLAKRILVTIAVPAEEEALKPAQGVVVKKGR